MEALTMPPPSPQRRSTPEFDLREINLTAGSNNELKPTQLQQPVFLVNRANGKALTVFQNKTVGFSNRTKNSDIFIKYSAGAWGVVGLKSKETNLSICVNRNAQIYARVVTNDHTDCRWNETMLSNNFFTYHSTDHKFRRKTLFFLGMNKNGTIRNASKTRQRQKYAQFGVVHANKTAIANTTTTTTVAPPRTRKQRTRKCRCRHPGRERCKKKCGRCLRKGTCVVRRRCKTEKCKRNRNIQKRQRLQKRCSRKKWKLVIKNGTDVLKSPLCRQLFRKRLQRLQQSRNRGKG